MDELGWVTQPSHCCQVALSLRLRELTENAISQYQVRGSEGLQGRNSQYRRLPFTRLFLSTLLAPLRPSNTCSSQHIPLLMCKA